MELWNQLRSVRCDLEQGGGMTSFEDLPANDPYEGHDKARDRKDIHAPSLPRCQRAGVPARLSPIPVLSSARGNTRLLSFRRRP